jgi:hypothetical protein
VRVDSAAPGSLSASAALPRRRRVRVGGAAGALDAAARPAGLPAGRSFAATSPPASPEAAAAPDRRRRRRGFCSPPASGAESAVAAVAWAPASSLASTAGASSAPSALVPAARVALPRPRPPRRLRRRGRAAPGSPSGVLAGVFRCGRPPRPWLRGRTRVRGLRRVVLGYRRVDRPILGRRGRARPARPGATATGGRLRRGAVLAASVGGGCSGAVLLSCGCDRRVAVRRFLHGALRRGARSGTSAAPSAAAAASARGSGRAAPVSSRRFRRRAAAGGLRWGDRRFHPCFAHEAILPLGPRRDRRAREDGEVKPWKSRGSLHRSRGGNDRFAMARTSRSGRRAVAPEVPLSPSGHRRRALRASSKMRCGLLAAAWQFP